MRLATINTCDAVLVAKKKSISNVVKLFLKNLEANEYLRMKVGPQLSGFALRPGLNTDAKVLQLI